MILGTKSNQLPILPGSIPDEQLILVPDPVTGELKRSTFGQVKADIILAIGDLSYLDDIIEVPTIADLPQPGQIKKIYVITTGPDVNKQFRWGGTIYIEFPQGSGDVAAEAVIRGNADTTLQANIDAETAARIAADSNLQTNINSEATARQNADTTLQNNLSAEANTRATNDSILQGMINTEASIRANADNDIDTRLDALESAGPGGPSLPSGGTSGQLLQKNSSTDGDASWSSTIPDEVTSLNADVANLESAVTTLTTDVANIKQSHFLGVFLNLAALVAAVPSPVAGDYADIDAGTGTDTLRYIYDADDDKWVQGGSGSGATTTDELPEGTANLYFETDRVLNTQLQDLAEGTQANIEATDNILSAFGKLKKFISSLLTSFNGPDKLMKFDSDGKYPAADGSLITNLPAGGAPFMTATGTNTYIVTNTPAVTALPRAIYVSFANANTGTSTLKIDSLAAVPIKLNGNDLIKANILAGAVKLLLLNAAGTFYQLQAGTLDLPPVPTGEKALTLNNAGLQINYDILDKYIDSIDDTGGVKTNSYMLTNYPTAKRCQSVVGKAGIYTYIGSNGIGWTYDQNGIL